MGGVRNRYDFYNVETLGTNLQYAKPRDSPVQLNIIMITEHAVKCDIDSYGNEKNIFCP